jgi:hypothetical protein
LLHDLALSLSGELDYRNALVQPHADPNTLHPLEQFSVWSFGDVVYASNAPITYTFGNALLAP